MKLISGVEIRGFRSLRSCRLDALDDFTVLAGLNNSGKSNVLRALNAFFNAETDERTPVNVDADFYRPDLKRKKAKQIDVSVRFTLPPQFKFRKGLDAVEKLLGGSEFALTKRWRREVETPTYFLGERELGPEERQRVDQFLQLITFRYIPNRVLPLDVVRKEHQALRSVLIRRLGRRAAKDQGTFAAIQETSRVLVKALADRIRQASPDVGDVRLATPSSWAEMLFALGYRLDSQGMELEDSVQGSGIQSLLMIETLYLIDRDYFQKFGWRQAAVWAVEEPESSLHTSLEARVAAYLQGISSDSSSRLQVLTTTHSDLMVQYARKVFVVSKKGTETVAEAAADPRSALQELSHAGVSRWSHPILFHPLEPIVLVEGAYDADFITNALGLMGATGRVQVTWVGDMEGEKGEGGVPRLQQYLRENRSAIRARRPDAPVVVVLDWDSRSKEAGFKSLFPEDGPYKVLVWPESDANPNLGKSLHGVERFFSDRLIALAESKGAQVFRSKKGICSVEKESYGDIKKMLNSVVLEGLEKGDLQHSMPFLKRLLTSAGVTL